MLVRQSDSWTPLPSVKKEAYIFSFTIILKRPPVLRGTLAAAATRNIYLMKGYRVTVKDIYR